MLYICEQETEKIRANIFYFKVCWIICFLYAKAYLHGQMYIQVTYCTSQRIAVKKCYLVLDSISHIRGGLVILEEFLFFFITLQK